MHLYHVKLTIKQLFDCLFNRRIKQLLTFFRDSDNWPLKLFIFQDIGFRNAPVDIGAETGGQPQGYDILGGSTFEFPSPESPLEVKFLSRGFIPLFVERKRE